MIVTACAAACDYASLAAAAARVPAGTTILVRGAQRGGVVIDRPLTVRGDSTAQISGGESGIVIRAPHVTVEGLTLSGYSVSDDAGNHGTIVLSRAADSRIAGNTIRDCTADSIRLWYSPRATIENNVVASGRDVFITYSPDVTFRGNTITNSRYGLHDMFSDRMQVTGNTFQGNEIGANFMYARGLTIAGNTFAANHGPTGYGIGLEDVDDSRITHNRILENHVGMNAVDSPTDPTAPDEIRANTFAHNGSAMTLQSNPHALRITANAFADNIEDVEVSGGGTAAGVVWSLAGRGNYWSAYAGYDRNGDGRGDIAYQPRSTFDSLTDAHPEMQMFRYSPAAIAVEFAARALPATAAQPKLRDAAPLIDMPKEAAAPARAKPNALAALLALLSIVPLAAGKRAAGLRSRIAARRRTSCGEAVAIEARGVRKQYPGGRGIEALDLCVPRGESVALWGPNGAGKTTFFRCILGERPDGGALRVFGTVPTPFERTTRSEIGYAPQHLPDFDARVGELAQLVAGIREAGAEAAEHALQLLHLSDSRQRFVNELSGGMRQRLAIALALIGDPPLLLLDEPTAGLDSESRRIVVELLQRERKRGKTLLITSHLPADVRALADRVVLLEDGRCAGEMPAEAFVAQYLRSVS
jgi:nitrous oxidase accessory protein